MTAFYLVFFMIFIGNVYAPTTTVFPHDIEDGFRLNAQSRIINMTYELIIEAKLLQRQMQPIQSSYEGQITYEIGYVMGKIRERYKRMIEIYKQAHYMTKHLYLNGTNDTVINNTIALKPGIKMYYPINWIINMEYIRLFEVDIDKLIEVLENIPEHALPKIDKSIPPSVNTKNPDAGDGPPGGIMRPPFKKPAYEPGVPGGTAVAPPGIQLARTGGRPGNPPGGVEFLRSGPPSVPNKPSPNVLNEPSPTASNEPRPSVPNKQPPSVPNEPRPSVPNKQPLSVPNEPRPSVPNEPRLSAPNEPRPSVANEPRPSAPNEQPPSAPNEPRPSVPTEQPPSVPNEPSPSFPNEPLPSVPNEPSPSVPNEPSPSVPNEPSPSVPNEQPPSQSYEPKGLSNESPLDSARQYYAVPRNQPYKPPPPGQPNDQPLGPQSWRTEPPAASYGKTNRFGPANTKFRTEEDLKRYYRAKYYNEKPDGINDKFENLYR